MIKPKPRSRIPRFSSYEEEANFWDTHSTTEFEDEFEPVEFEVADPLMHAVMLRFDGPTFKRIHALAKARGIGSTALMREWVLETLAKAEAAQASEDSNSNRE